MATENNGVTEQPVDAVANPAAEETTVAADLKGKGKAVATAESHGDVAMDEDDDDEEEDEEAAEDAEEEDDEEGAEGEGAISLDNVVGRRTRGKVIDFAKAAEENPADEYDDSDEDEDFREEDDDDKMDED